MNFDYKEHFEHIVVPAWRAYRTAENELSHAAMNGEGYDQACFTALRQGAAAVLLLHHFADIVVARQVAEFIGKGIRDVAGVQAVLATQCKMLRGEKSTDDVALLGDIADALKHGVITRRLDVRKVVADDAVVVVGSGFGKLRFGEGKYGGIDQVIIVTLDGERALSSILQNVVDAWHRLLGLRLPELD